jgi:hypothetical protein
VNSDPPLPIPLTTSGGVRVNHFPLQNRPPQIHKTTFLPVSTSQLPGRISGKWKRILKNERGFCSERDEEQKNLPFFHRCHQLGESKPSFSPFFRFPVFPVSVLILWGLFRRDGDEIGETKGGFFSRQSHLQ